MSESKFASLIFVLRQTRDFLGPGYAIQHLKDLDIKKSILPCEYNFLMNIAGLETEDEQSGHESYAALAGNPRGCS